MKHSNSEKKRVTQPTEDTQYTRKAGEAINIKSAKNILPANQSNVQSLRRDASETKPDEK